MHATRPARGNRGAQLIARVQAEEMGTIDAAGRQDIQQFIGQYFHRDVCRHGVRLSVARHIGREHAKLRRHAGDQRREDVRGLTGRSQ